MNLKSLLLALPIVLLPQVASAETLSVKLNSANFRERPHEAAKVKFTADKFYPVEVVEKKAGWVKVKDFEGDEAWVTEKALAKVSTVVINVDKANIREAANTTSDVLFKVERGEVFKIEEHKGQWLKVVDAHGDGGWLRDDMTWGEELAELEKVVTDKVEKADKAAKPEAKPSETKAKEPSEKVEPHKADPKEKSAAAEDRVQKAAEKIAGKISEPENLENLCRAYLDADKVIKTADPSAAVKAATAVVETATAPATSAKPKAEPKQHKADPKAKPAPKNAKPKPAEKKKK